MEIYIDEENKYYFGEIIKCRNSIRLSISIFPFMKKWYSFFSELVRQLTNEMVKYVNREYLKNFDYMHCFEPVVYYSDAIYYKRKYGSDILPDLYKKTQYFGKFLKLHYDGYSYGLIQVVTKSGDVAFLWIRWKSLLEGYEYIEADDELDNYKNAFKVEICTEWDDELKLIHQKGNCITVADEKYRNMNGWIDFINDPKNFPKKRVKLPAKITLPYEISDNPADYPDMQVSFYFDGSVTDETAKKTEKVLGDCVNQYNAERESRSDDDRCIHYVSDPEINENAVSFHIDFGNAEPMKAIKYIVKYVQQGSIGVVRVMFE